MITGQVLFPGSSDIDQLCKIFDVFGTPSETDWPEVVNLPNYLPFNETAPSDLGDAIGKMRKQTDDQSTAICPEAIDLLKSLLQLSPAKRQRPQAAL